MDEKLTHERVLSLLQKAAAAVCSLLQEILPSISEKWWEVLVLSHLSFQQRRAVEAKRVTKLSGLDLAALLRVLDSNWYEVSEKLALANEGRHFLKELRTVRDRWAHSSVAEFAPEDIYRDLDTLQRFLMAIEADDEILVEVKAVKEAALPLGGSVRPPSSAPESRAAFQVGQVVSLKTDGSCTGVVTGVNPAAPETRYSVFEAGSIKTYYESQLQPVRPPSHIEPIALADFDAYLSALQIRHPSTSIVYSLNAARIDCVPYQFRPVLKFIRAERPRLLIADGVGVGKTIEAGLILKELQARVEVQRVLVICPKPLITERKWESEMKRFDERFVPLDGDKLRYCVNETDLDGVWPEQYAKAILPYSLLDEELLFGSRVGTRRRRKGLLDLDPFPRFDLIIVDEAQHVRNPETYAHRCVRIFCENADAAVFLTATPLEMGSSDLYILLNLLRPDLVRDFHTFEVMTQPNPLINAAAALARSSRDGWNSEARAHLEQAAKTSWGALTIQSDPTFLTVMETLAKPAVSQPERVGCIRQIEQLHTLSGIVNRTRRRDIGDFTVRRPDTVTVDFTDAQRKLHDDLLATQALILMTLHPSANVKFLMTMIRRQAASCLYGLVPLLQGILTRHLGELSYLEADTPEFDQPATIDSVIESKIADVLRQAQALDPYDPKLDALKRVVKEKMALPNRRIMVFSSFRHTLAYLRNGLAGQGVRVGLVHGDVPDEERNDMRRRFQLAPEDPDAIDILLFSEVGSEGLDYQFCDCIVNYDLPWNPMRIEQRIGRIDRRGQTSEKIRIVNIITPGTVDADIYERCLLRIGIFDRELGASDEILGEMTRELRNIAEDFTLTEHERRGKLQQLADNQVRLIREQQDLEDRQAELFALRVPLVRAEEELQDASSRWLSPTLLDNLIRRYLATLSGEQAGFLGEKAVKTLRLNQDTRNSLLADFGKLPRLTAVTYRDWENWLKGNNPHLRVTLEPKAATENPDAILLSPVHPLVRQAASSFAQRERAVTACQVKSNLVPAGDHAFAVYQWRFLGLQEDLQLQPVTLKENLRSCFGQLLSEGTPLDLVANEVPSSSVLDDLERVHYDLWSVAREQHREENFKRATFRLASLESSHQARISLLQDQFARATDERIRRMHQAQIERAVAEHTRRVEEVNRAKVVTDVQAQVVAFGIIRVRP
ncbi:MAG TPA: helicase-related protein [Bryobacteraceae bacterium]|nr:helicase-related protein [Bryobacteraceae bacterium]